MTLHVIHFIHGINENTVAQLTDRCLGAIHQGASELQLRLSSTSGGTREGFTLCHFLKTFPVKVPTHNLGSVESMAVPVFLSAAIRTADPNSRFKVHPLTWNVGAAMSVPHNSPNEWASALDDEANRYVEVFEGATRNAKTPFDVGKVLRGQNMALLTPTDAVAAGMVHEITAADVPTDAVSWWVNP